MEGGISGGVQTFWFWGGGIVLLGLLLAYAALRAGYLRPGERARIDRNTEAALRAHDAAERNGPVGNASRAYAIMIPAAVAALAIVLIIWSFTDTHGPAREATNDRQTTGSAPPKSSQPPTAVPTAPSNDAAGDSARGSQGPLNRTR
jgi:hypothetical protein